MSVNLRRFVDININRAKRNPVNPVRDTVALYNTAVTPLDDKIIVGYEDRDATSINVLLEDGSHIQATKESNIAKYVIPFFDNGGLKIHAYAANFTATSLTDNDKHEIAVAKCEGLTAEDVAIIKAYNDAHTPDASSDSTNAVGSSAKVFFTFVASSQNDVDITALTESNICAKCGTAGIEMIPMAYLSRINAYGTNTVHDYAFTIEHFAGINAATYKGDDDNVTLSDALVKNCMDKHVNVDTVLANQIRNIGGDLIDGNDLVNHYMTIVMQQTLEETLVNTLSEKLAGADGTAKIYNVIIAELNKYVKCGLLAAGNWQNEDWIESYNGVNFKIVSANERLTIGYKVYVVPFASLSTEDVANHLCPPVYIALTDAYGIRKITIAGEVM